VTADVAVEAAAAILSRKEELALAITEALYRRRPDFMERYGAAGREKCLQDMRYNLEHLAPAVGLDEPELFGRYARWLEELLRARGVPVDDVRDSLEVTVEVTASRLPADQSARVAASLRAGLAALSDDAS
jgi:hypothetical protein